jgi:hypothetical protein
MVTWGQEWQDSKMWHSRWALIQAATGTECSSSGDNGHGSVCAQTECSRYERVVILVMQAHCPSQPACRLCTCLPAAAATKPGCAGWTVAPQCSPRHTSKCFVWHVECAGTGDPCFTPCWSAAWLQQLPGQRPGPPGGLLQQTAAAGVQHVRSAHSPRACSKRSCSGGSCRGWQLKQCSGRCVL